MGWGERNCRERLRGGEAAGHKTASLSTADTSAPGSWRSSSRAGRRCGAVVVASPSAHHGHLRGVDSRVNPAVHFMWDGAQGWVSDQFVGVMKEVW